MARDVKKVSVDVPTELYEKLALIARAEQRSMSNLMVYILSTVADDYSGANEKRRDKGGRRHENSLDVQTIIEHDNEPSGTSRDAANEMNKSGVQLPDWYTSANDPKLLGFRSVIADR